MIHECTIKINRDDYETIRHIIGLSLNRYDCTADEYEEALMKIGVPVLCKWDEQFYHAYFSFDDGTEFLMDVVSDDFCYYTAWQWYDACHKYTDKWDDFADMWDNSYQFEPANTFMVKMEDGHFETYICKFDIID